jgi:hypothetical protein
MMPFGQLRRISISPTPTAHTLAFWTVRADRGFFAIAFDIGARPRDSFTYLPNGGRTPWVSSARRTV